MIIELKLDGSARLVMPQNLYQGSNRVTDIKVVAPLGSSAALEIAFEFPSGVKTLYHPMEFVDYIAGTAVGTWRYALTSTITAEVGTVKAAINVITSDGNRTSYAIEFTVQPSILPETPETPNEDDEVWTELLQVYQNNATGLTAEIARATGVEDTINDDLQAHKVREDTINDDLQAHKVRIDNPHSVNKSQVGLGSVDNTSDLSKPVSAATQAALNLKENTANREIGSAPTDNTMLYSSSHTVRAYVTAQLTAKADLVSGKVPDTQIKQRVFNEYIPFPLNGQEGIIYVDFTNQRLSLWSDALHTYVPIPTQADLDNYISAAQKGASSGVASLDSSGKVPSSQLPSYVDDVLEYANLAAFPATGESGKIYVTRDTNKTYRWGGSVYVEISESLALGETSSTACRGDRGKTAYDHSLETGNPHNTTKVDVGLGNLTNDKQVKEDQGVENNGKILGIEDGKVIPVNAQTGGSCDCAIKSGVYDLATLTPEAAGQKVYYTYIGTIDPKTVAIPITAFGGLSVGVPYIFASMLHSHDMLTPEENWSVLNFFRHNQLLTIRVERARITFFKTFADLMHVSGNTYNTPFNFSQIMALMINGEESDFTSTTPNIITFASAHDDTDEIRIEYLAAPTMIDESLMFVENLDVAFSSFPSGDKCNVKYTSYDNDKWYQQMLIYDYDEIAHTAVFDSDQSPLPVIIEDKLDKKVSAFVSENNPDGDVVAEINENKERISNHGTRLTTLENEAGIGTEILRPVFQPDRTYVLYCFTGDGTDHLYLAEGTTNCYVNLMDGTEPIQLTYGGDITLPATTAGIRYIVITGEFQGFSINNKTDRLKYIEAIQGTNCKAIGNRAFLGCNLLEKTIIPNGITSIGSYAYSITSISSIYIPNGVTSIGEFAFSSCGRLMSARFPTSGLTFVGYNAFAACWLLNEPNIPKTAQDGAFNSCYSLKALIGKTNSTSISNHEFMACYGLTQVFLTSVISIGNYGFGNCCSLTSLALPSTLNEIGEHAFEYCISLNRIDYNGTKSDFTFGTNAFLEVKAFVYAPGAGNNFREAFVAAGGTLLNP
jgi:hypothetical protein